jgi:hypothetical protein
MPGFFISLPYSNAKLMKKILSVAIAVLIFHSLNAQQTRYYNAADLNVIGKAIPTPKDFTRIDTSAYRFNDKVIDEFACHSTGLAVLFATDSPFIKARWQTSPANASENMTAIAQKGLDLYIRQDGEWVFAGVGRPQMDKGPEYASHEGTIVKSMAPGRKECILYLPLYDRLDSLFIGVQEGSYVVPMENPFKYRIVVKGSSVTHGLAASRPGMSYAARFGRNNGFYCFNLGFSGKSKLQEEYARYLADIEDVDAFIFDAFSNPSAEIINENFDRFVDIIREGHPDVPLIFMQTERRESRNFDTWREDFEAKKQAAAEKAVRERMKKDKHIYFIPSDDFLGDEHIATSDGSHPTDLGFTYMLESISPKILKILRKYGIR